MSKLINIVGAGPGGLFCSYLLLNAGFRVNLYDQMSGVGKKFLVAGNGGLNITHSEELEKFATRYGEDAKLFSNYLKAFSPSNLRDWCSGLGVETFVGSSGRVFPKKLKAAELLSLWLKRLKESDDFTLKLKHRLIDINLEGDLSFENEGSEHQVSGDYTVLSLGGGSWKKTGSDGKWVKYLSKLNLNIEDFRSMNCGFTVDWSKHFLNKFEDAFIKNIKISFQDESVAGEIMLTRYGVEGGAVYALSSLIQSALLSNKDAIIYLDLKPALSFNEIFEKLNRPRGKSSLSNHLRKSLGFSKTSIQLIREVSSKESFGDMNELAKIIKRIPLKLIEARPLDEAISTGGGVKFSSLDDSLMIKNSNSIYLVGEMLDWEAPTGGYLLQGCFSMGYHVAQSIITKNL